MSDEKEKSIGALWQKQSGKGTNYFSGSIELEGKKISIVVFKNQFKEQDKHPDWKIFLQKPRESENTHQQQIDRAESQNKFEDPLS